MTHLCGDHEPVHLGYLGPAAHAKHAAYAAEKAGDLDGAWSLQHERRTNYLRHANSCGFTITETLALDACVAEDLANILRKQGMHLDAFTQVLYWATAQRDRPKKAHATKVRAYFNRSGIKAVSLGQVHVYIENSAETDFLSALDAVRAWASA